MTKENENLFLTFLSFCIAAWEALVSIFHSFQYKMPTESPNNRWNNETLNDFRKIGDDIAQECYNRLKAEHGDHFPPSFDIIAEIKKRANLQGEENAIYREFYEQTYRVPAWVDFDQIERGAKTIKRSTLPAGMLVLTAGSLVQSYAGANGAEVLVETGRLKDDVIKRIIETGYFLHLCVIPRNLLPGLAGHKAVLQIRMLHCAVRNYLLTREKQWNKEALGVPINQEDLIGTFCVFVNVFAECHSKLGYVFTQQDYEDLLMLWRYIGYLIGIKEDLLAKNYQEATDIALGIFRHQCHPTHISSSLVNQLFDSIHLSPYFFCLPRRFWHELSRYLLGDDTSDKMGIQPKSENWFLLVRFFIVVIKLQFLIHKIPFVLAIEERIKIVFWNIFMYVGLKGRSADYKMKRY